MQRQTIGIVTYDHPHLKTEQVMRRLVTRNDLALRMFALPFKPRKPRTVLFQHRPDQADAIHPAVIADEHDLEFVRCRDDTDIDAGCDVYLILGAGVLSAQCVAGKKMINCHPGIIPASRGLDSFKWAIYHLKPLGVTLHYIDEQVDAGEIIAILPTGVYPDDTIDTLAHRHYENEIECMSLFEEYLRRPVNPFAHVAADDARMRMPLDSEKELPDRFVEYVRKFGRQQGLP